MTARDLAVVRMIEVACPAAEVFALFTEQPATWWPLARWSHGSQPAVGLTFEPRLDGRIYDTDAEGHEAEWGTITTWDPPHHLAFDYRPFADERLTEVDLRFEPLSDSTVRVHLTHTGWERHGEDGVRRSRGYATGWKQALDLLADAATPKTAKTGDTR